MLWTLIVLLLLFWVLGFAFHVAGGIIHVLLVIAVVLFLVNLLSAATNLANRAQSCYRPSEWTCSSFRSGPIGTSSTASARWKRRSSRRARPESSDASGTAFRGDAPPGRGASPQRRRAVTRRTRLGTRCRTGSWPGWPSASPSSACCGTSGGKTAVVAVHPQDMTFEQVDDARSGGRCSATTSATGAGWSSTALLLIGRRHAHPGSRARTSSAYYFAFRVSATGCRCAARRRACARVDVDRPAVPAAHRAARRRSLERRARDARIHDIAAQLRLQHLSTSSSAWRASRVVTPASDMLGSSHVKLRELAERLACRLEGDGDIEITRVAGIQDAGPGDLTFLANPKYQRRSPTTRASAVILRRRRARRAPCAMLRDARIRISAFARAVGLFAPAGGPRPACTRWPRSPPTRQLGAARVDRRVRRGRRRRARSATARSSFRTSPSAPARASAPTASSTRTSPSASG